MRLLLAVLALLLLPGAARAAASFDSVRAMPLSGPLAGMPYADPMERAGFADDAMALRMGLLAGYLDHALGGTRWPAGRTLGEAMDTGRALLPLQPGRRPVPEWAEYVARSVELRWVDGALPFQLAHMADRLERRAPGRWSMPASGLVRYAASIELVNHGLAPITLPAFRLRWEAGPDLLCAEPGFDSPNLRPVPPGQARPFVCQDVLPPQGLAAFVQAVPQVVPPQLDQPAGLKALVAALGSASPAPDPAFERRLREIGHAAAAAPARGAERGAGSPPPAPAPSAPPARADAQTALWFGAGVVVVFVLFAAGRVFVRRGTPVDCVIGASAAVLALASVVVAVATWSAPSGDGWSRITPFAVAAFVLMVGLGCAIVVTLLHGLHRLLDAEHTTWPATVARAWAGVVHFNAASGRAEFWGYITFAMAVLASVRVLLPVGTPVAAAVCALPLPALLVRRLRALTRAEAWGLALVAGLVLLDLLLSR